MKKFEFFKNMPPEIIPEISLFQTMRERITTDSLISKYFYDNVKNPLAWNYTGAIDYNDFVQRIQALPIEYRDLIFSDTKPYTLPMAEKIVRILALPKADRVREFFTPEQVEALSQHNTGVMPGNNFPANSSVHPSLHYLMSNNGIIALCEGLPVIELTTTEHFSPFICFLLSSYNGVIALREGYVTLQDALARNPMIRALRCKNSIFALGEGLITLAQASNIDSSLLEVLLSDEGIYALQKGLITPEEVAAMPVPTLQTGGWSGRQKHLERVINDRLRVYEEENMETHGFAL